MSDDSLQLSPTLLKSLQEALQANDPRSSDPAVSVQYLAAVIGYLVAQLDEPRAEREDFLHQLAQFTVSVFQDVDGQRSAAPPPQAATGVWRPGDP